MNPKDHAIPRLYGDNVSIEGKRRFCAKILNLNTQPSFVHSDFYRGKHAFSEQLESSVLESDVFGPRRLIRKASISMETNVSKMDDILVLMLMMKMLILA